MSRSTTPVFSNAVPKAHGLALGTLILTPGGPEFIENLTPGDLIMTRDSGAQALAKVTRTIPTHMHCVAPQSDAAPWRHLWLAAADGTPNVTARACISLQCKTGQVIWAEGVPVAVGPSAKPKAHAKSLIMA